MAREDKEVRNLVLIFVELEFITGITLFKYNQNLI